MFPHTQSDLNIDHVSASYCVRKRSLRHRLLLFVFQWYMVLCGPGEILRSLCVNSFTQAYFFIMDTWSTDLVCVSFRKELYLTPIACHAHAVMFDAEGVDDSCSYYAIQCSTHQVLDSTLYIPALSPAYWPDRLASLLAGDRSLWLEFLPADMMQEEKVMLENIGMNTLNT